jgi:hypothetical protein
MSQASLSTDRVGDGGRAQAARVGAVATVLALALVVYGTYGDPKAPSSQKSGMPSILVIAVVLGIVVFGFLAPRALRAVDVAGAAGRRWAVGLTTVAVVGLVVFWTGLPLIVGSAAALVGRAGRESRRPSRAFSVAWVLGLVAAGASILVTILGNLLH